MKKKFAAFGLLSALVLGLAACGGGSDEKATKESAGGKSGEDTTIIVGASPTPHAEILEEAKPLLKEKGFDLEIKVFDDYILPNTALESKELDANYFQHIPYFENAVEENNFDFVNAGKVHIELMALYSQQLKDIKDLEEGATVLTSNSETDWGRIITILQDAGLVKVKDGVDLLTATFDDIAENPKNLKFKYDLDPGMMTSAYQNDEAALIAINANFANGIGLSPKEDGVLVEKDNSPYANIVAVRTGDEKTEKIKALMDVLHSEEITSFIEEKWSGTITPIQ
ncbi:MetQ/NlpA family ABC transporter substrate-binding protein [Vagococcus acidifermentans]|uniref:Lipoprotein n=1 Tax=Vagococcus acidifermentans TaxID=564710 RepID=A0A430B0U8_9ENTE|nr:MetQ/NlpA family ABC transporter substrate-binding protein [Vagococcus acidifermentans]RSU13926.1 methionine ABC transporter substrate-binding protein [Vagococcus acidifermentans]